jgi:hypothetical protein
MVLIFNLISVKQNAMLNGDSVLQNESKDKDSTQG